MEHYTFIHLSQIIPARRHLYGNLNFLKMLFYRFKKRKEEQNKHSISQNFTTPSPFLTHFHAGNCDRVLAYQIRLPFPEVSLLVLLPLVV